jgi:Putative peptidoglycan binding domain
METKIWALYTKSRIPWFLTAVLAFGSPAPTATATASPLHQQQGAALSWATYHPKGWSAGSVSLGTGYWRPGASRRVREVQRRLDQLGYGAGKVDGFFGPITDAAVHRYQRGRALRVDGIVGPRTLKDLRSRTRRAQGSVDRNTTGSEPKASGGNRIPSATAVKQSPRSRLPLAPDRHGPNPNAWWWNLMPFITSAFVITLIAAVITLLRPKRRRYERMYVEGRSEDARIGDFRGFAYTMWPVGGEPGEPQEAPSLLVYDWSKPNPVPARLSEVTAVNGRRVEIQSSVTALSSRRRKSTSEWTVSRRSAFEQGELRIAPRIDEPAIESGGVTPPRTATAESRGLGGAQSSARFRWLGARVHLADAEGMTPVRGTLPVELELFAESESSRWETGLLENDEPFRVSIEDLESSVRALVVPGWLPALANAFAKCGMVRPHSEELARLPFAVELSIEVERVIAERSLFQMRAG